MSQHKPGNKSVVQEAGVQFYTSDSSSTVSRPHYLPVYVRQCKMLTGKRTVQCCHIALRTAVAVQHSDYSSDRHTDEHLQHLHRHNWALHRPETNCRSATQHPVPCSDRSCTVRLYRKRQLIAKGSVHCLIQSSGKAGVHGIRTD